jgi:hypothetical protein
MKRTIFLGLASLISLLHLIKSKKSLLHLKNSLQNKKKKRKKEHTHKHYIYRERERDVPLEQYDMILILLRICKVMEMYKFVILVLVIGSSLVGITQSVRQGAAENFQSYPQSYSYPNHTDQYTTQHWCCKISWKWICCDDGTPQRG